MEYACNKCLTFMVVVAVFIKKYELIKEFDVICPMSESRSAI